MRTFILFLLLLTGCQSEHTFHNIIQPVIAAGDEVDILMIADKSCSMAENEGIVAYEAAIAVRDLDQVKADWRIGVTDATEQSSNGVIIIDDYRDPGRAVLNALGELNGWSGGEEGFAAALNRKETAPDFFRPGAVSVLIFISDEPEQSDLTPEDLRTEWHRDLGIVSIAGGTVPLPELVAVEGCHADPAPKYEEAADVFIDICSWGPWNMFAPLIEE